jgi:hypothetical protein
VRARVDRRVDRIDRAVGRRPAVEVRAIETIDDARVTRVAR